jgi:hypothetical protein
MNILLVLSQSASTLAPQKIWDNTPIQQLPSLSTAS